jgi:peptidyl-tRNA hydrolase ICT1
MLHSSVRSSQYYTASSDALTFQAQEHRSRTANADENKKKLLSEITRIYSKVVPAETGDDKREKYKRV